MINPRKKWVFNLLNLDFTFTFKNSLSQWPLVFTILIFSKCLKMSLFSSLNFVEIFGDNLLQDPLFWEIWLMCDTNPKVIFYTKKGVCSLLLFISLLGLIRDIVMRLSVSTLFIDLVLFIHFNLNQSNGFIIAHVKISVPNGS